MKSMVKKIIIYSLVGVMQFGLGATVLEASPRHNNQQEQYQTDNNSDNWNGGHYQQQGYGDRHHDRDVQIREENYRHEQEMCRRDGESDRDWHDRQRYESERHDDAVKAIAAGAILYLLLNNN